MIEIPIKIPSQDVQNDEVTTTISALFDKLHDLYRQIAAVEREIVARGKFERGPRVKRSTSAEVTDVIQATVKVLRDAGRPLPRKEIAAHLGISPWAASYRLQKAVEEKLIEKTGGGKYRALPVQTGDSPST